MKMQIPVLLLIVTIIILSLEAQSQKSQNNFDLDMGFWNANQGGQVRLYAGLGHEWKFLPFLGIELTATSGIVQTNSDWFKVISGNYDKYKGNISFTYHALCPKVNGYLNLKYDERDVPVGYLYAGIGIGISTVKSKGTIKTSNGLELKSNAEISPRLYTDFEIGYGAKVGENVHMELAIRADNIPFEKAVSEINEQSDEFPTNFAPNIYGGSIQLTFTYFYKNKK